jgi:hypothetical protein
MNFVEEFKKLESGDFAFFVFAVCGSVCPGVLAIWLFNPDLVVAATTPKLVILSLSFMLPYIALNSWIVGMTTGVPASTPKEKIYIQLFLQASVWSLFMFSGGLMVRFLFDVSLLAFVIILTIGEIVFLVLQLGKLQTLQQPHRNGKGEQKPTAGEQPKV